MPKKLDLYQVRIKVESLMREDVVVDLYETRRYRVVTRTEEDTRRYFAMPEKKTADMVIEVSPRHAIIAEVKGSSVSDALEQLRTTAPYVRLKNYNRVECKIFLRTATPTGDTENLRGGEGEEARLGFQVMRVYNRNFPAEWLLQRYFDDGSRDFVRIDGELVSVIFGPYPKA